MLLMRKCYLRDIKEMYAWAERMATWGRERQKSFLDYALQLVRENFVYNFHLPQLIISRKAKKILAQFRPFCQRSQYSRHHGRTDECAPRHRPKTSMRVWCSLTLRSK